MRQHAIRLPVAPARSVTLGVLLVVVVALCSGLFGYLVQAAHNRQDAEERFALISKRVARQIVDRMHRYEYGLRGARGVAVAADGRLTRAGFSRYAASRQIDREFAGARGFGIVLRVPESDENDFVAARRQVDAPDFSIKSLGEHRGDRFVITFVEPADRNREALGLDIGSEPSRREAAMAAARSLEATLTAPLTLVQANRSRSGGLLLLLPIHRPGPSEDRPDQPAQQLVGWSYAPLLIEDVLQGLDTEEALYELALYDLDYDATRPFFSGPNAPASAGGEIRARVGIPLYGRRWEAVLSPTPAFFASLHQASAASLGLLAMTLGAAVAALIATLVQLADRTRGHRLELARRAAIVEGSADAIVVQTLDGVITDWNEGAERLFGYSKAEAKGRAATPLLLPPDLEAEDAAIRHTVARGERVLTFETVRLARDRTPIPVSITASPIRDASGVVVGSAKILRDVRDAKAVQQRMKELNASLEEQVRERTALLAEATREAREANEAKSRFLANISHEIRTPMNAVIGMTHLLGRTPLDDEQSRMVTIVSTAGRTLLALINDVLDLSKIEARHMVLEAAPFGLQELVAEVASMAEVSARQGGIDFVLDSDVPAELAVAGDRTRFGQIVLNLLTNAIKFTAQGRVTLTVRAGDADEAGLLPITVAVIDTGIGIPPDVQTQLFRPFVQADTSTTRRFGGTGLGLSIVRQLVDLMGGTISLRSRPGEGSAFEVAVKLAACEAAPADPAPLRTGLSRRDALKGRHVLVVDDNELNREIAGRILREEGVTVSLAANGKDAVDFVEARGRTIDAVLMDVQMPVMDGLEAARRILQLNGGERHLPIIGLTAGVSEEERAAARAAGMSAVVGKPFDPEVLAWTVAAQVSKGASSTSNGGQGSSQRRELMTAAEPSDDWPDIAMLDRRISFRNLRGDAMLLRRMVLQLRRTLAAAATLRDAQPVDRASWRSLSARLHDFKSLAGTLGGTGLSTAAANAERLIREENWEKAGAALNELVDQGQSFEDSARRILPDKAWQETPREDTSETGTPLGDSGDLALLMAHLAM